MVYSDVVNRGWILPRKEKYTKRDADKIVLDSLFGKYGPRTIDARLAHFIVKCSAVYHGTDWSNYFDRLPARKAA